MIDAAMAVGYKIRAANSRADWRVYSLAYWRAYWRAYRWASEAASKATTEVNND